MTVDDRLRDAASDLRDAVRADALAPLGRLPSSSRRTTYRRPVVVYAIAGAVAVVLVVTIVVGSRRTGTTTHLATQPTTPGCADSFVLPFAPRYLPTGWKPAGHHIAHAQRGTDFIEPWMGPSTYGVIEVWRGTNIPVPGPPLATIRVLGQNAELGPISDGSSVVFTIGADPTNPCNRWALVAHPGITEDMLRRVAIELVPVHS